MAAAGNEASTTDDVEEKLLKHITGVEAYASPPTSLYLALGTAAPSDASPTSWSDELSGNGYSRKLVEFNAPITNAVKMLSVGGFGKASGHTLAYSNALPGKWDFGNGYNWFVEEWPFLLECIDSKLTSSDSFPQSAWVRWSAQDYNDQGHLTASRVYHTIPGSGTGSSGTNYDQTTFGTDAVGRRNRVTSPGGTITRTVFDLRGQQQKVYVGTNDTAATDSDPTGGSASGNNMVQVN